ATSWLIAACVGFEEISVRGFYVFTRMRKRQVTVFFRFALSALIRGSLLLLLNPRYGFLLLIEVVPCSVRAPKRFRLPSASPDHPLRSLGLMIEFVRLRSSTQLGHL